MCLRVCMCVMCYVRTAERDAVSLEAAGSRAPVKAVHQ